MTELNRQYLLELKMKNMTPKGMFIFLRIWIILVDIQSYFSKIY